MEIEERLGVPFARADGEPVLLDAYVPSGAGPFPALVLFHGGAWSKGTRGSYAGWGRWLARHGYVAASADYRLAQPGRPSFPGAVHDAIAAVGWVRENAAALRADAARLGVMGGSAGGHLAAMTVLAAREPHFGGGPSGASVAICMAGAFDLLRLWEHDQLDRPPGDNSVERFAGGDPAGARRTLYDASPLFHASTANAHGTRWLLAWGTEDDVIPPAEQSVPFSRALKRAGAVVRHAPIPGAAHFWYFEADPDEPGSHSDVLARRIRSFLRNWAGW